MAVQVFPDTVAWKGAVPLHGSMSLDGSPHHPTVGFVHDTPVGVPQSHAEQVAASHTRPALPMTLVFGYGAAHEGTVFASPS
jgi:hypothetical protein